MVQEDDLFICTNVGEWVPCTTWPLSSETDIEKRCQQGVFCVAQENYIPFNRFSTYLTKCIV